MTEEEFRNTQRALIRNSRFTKEQKSAKMKRLEEQWAEIDESDAQNKRALEESASKMRRLPGGCGCRRAYRPQYALL